MEETGPQRLTRSSQWQLEATSRMTLEASFPFFALYFLFRK